jgi:hypothetical protein
MSDIVQTLLTKPAETVAVAAEAPVESKPKSLNIPVGRAEAVMTAQGINAVQTQEIEVINENISKLPAATKLRETRKALADYKAEHKAAHPEADSILKAAEAAVKEEKKTPEYQALVTQRKDVSSKKKHTSGTSKYVGAVAAEFAVTQCVLTALENDPSLKKLTMGDILNGKSVMDKAISILFRDGKHTNATIQKFRRDEKVRMENERAATAAAASKNNVHNVNPAAAKPVEAEPTVETPDEDEDDNISPKHFITSTQQICKSILADHRAKQVLAGVVVPEKTVSVEGEVKKFLSEVAFDVLDTIGRGIIASFNFTTNKTLTGDNVELIIDTLFKCANVSSVERDLVFKKINDVIEEHKQAVKLKRENFESKKSDEEKQKILEARQAKKAKQDAINSIRLKYKEVINNEIKAVTGVTA